VGEMWLRKIPVLLSLLLLHHIYLNNLDITKIWLDFPHKKKKGGCKEHVLWLSLATLWIKHHDWKNHSIKGCSQFVSWILITQVKKVAIPVMKLKCF
jgi:hypothetical protein